MALIVPSVVFAANGFGAFIGVQGDDVRLIVLRVFQIFWILVGIACAALGGYGIYLYRSASGDEEELHQGKRFMLIGAIGVVVVIALSIILAQIYGSMAKKTASQVVGTEVEFPSQFFSEMLGAGGRVAEHFPTRDAKNIPRNARIIITFKESIRIESVRDDAKKLKTDVIRIQQVFPQVTGVMVNAAGAVETNSDHTVLTIAPEALFGEKNKKSTYAVTLTNALQNEKGEKIFSTNSGYSWQFEVSGLVDNTPPQLESAQPLPQASGMQQQIRYPYNHLIQMTFTKPIDPLSITGDKIEVINDDLSTKVLGSVTVGNGFRTVTFLPKTSCGKNACSETIFCLPQKNRLHVTAKAASLPKTRSSESPNRAVFPYDGIVDVMGNSLDGGGVNAAQKNGKSDGPPTDSVTYSFATSDQFASTPPQVTYIMPKRDGTKVDLTQPIQADFSSFMDLTSLHSSTFMLSKELNYWIVSTNDSANKKTTSQILHDTLKPNTIYKPEIQSAVKDITQQCFNPCIGPTP
ncbi:MAG: Ig-like domain-containing protein [Patescibacteria group bacterium]